MSSPRGPWPAVEDLAALRKEAAEHRRAWALVAGLTNHIAAQRSMGKLTKPGKTPPLVGPKPETYADRVKHLEEKIVAQKRRISELEACRKYEAETERLLVEGLEQVVNAPIGSMPPPRSRAKMALLEYGERRGPRPTA